MRPRKMGVRRQSGRSELSAAAVPLTAHPDAGDSEEAFLKGTRGRRQARASKLAGAGACFSAAGLSKLGRK